MKIHHLNCGTLCPMALDKMVCHCLLIESSEGLILVDSGFGREDVLHPRERLSKTIGLLGIKLKIQETAHAQIQALGFKVEDVRHIVLTHLDMDHSGGLPDFPNAKIHVHQREFDIANAPKPSFLSSHRYRPIQWAHHPKWEFYNEDEGETWFGFKSIRNLRGLKDDIFLIPLFGHTHGHCGIAVCTDQGWLLHAGDAYFYHGEMNADPRCPTILSVFQRILAMDNASRIQNQKRLHDLAVTKKSEVTVFCAHDGKEFERA